MTRVLVLLLAAPLLVAADIVPPPDLPPPDLWVRTGGGQVRVLDKQKAQSHLLELHNGQAVTFESLSLTLLACVVKPPDLVGNAAGFLQITDSHDGQPGFRGWMVARQPGLATLQSPVYDVHVVGCDKPTAAELAVAIPPKPPAPPPADASAPPAPSNPATDLNPPSGQDLTTPPPEATPPQ
jgi:hypothetical protein